MEFNWKPYQGQLDVNEIVYEARLNKNQYLFKTLINGKWKYWADNRSLAGYKKFYIPIGENDVKKIKNTN
jgi:hypothetical protein